MAAPTRLLAITNPASGPPAARTHRAAQLEALAALPFPVRVEETRAPGHARELAREVPAEPGLAIAAVGGDGTLHEVVDGLLSRDDRPAIPVAVIAAGTGNATARDLGLGPGPDPLVPGTVAHAVVPAAAAIAAGRTRRIDVARLDVDGEVVHAVNVVGWGAFARINARAERLRWSGRARYTLAAVAELMAPRLRDAETAVDGAPGTRHLLGCACLTRYSGAGMELAPRAVLDDGYADLVLIRRAPRLVLAGLLRRVFDGSHVRSPRVEYRRVDELRLTLEPGGAIVVDGELRPAREVRLHVLCRALEVFHDEPAPAPPPPAAPFQA